MKRVIFFVIFLSLYINATGQASPENVRISLKAKNLSTGVLLDNISSASGILFTYNSKLINDNKKISLTRENCEVGKILDDVLTDNLTYKVVGNNIVIVPKTEITELSENARGFSIKGKIIDDETMIELPFATVNIDDKPIGTITGENGVFELKTDFSTKNDTLIISYMGYVSQKVLISELSDGKMHSFRLKKKTYELGPVLVTPIKAEEIVKESLKKLSSSNVISDENLKAYYRESYYADSAFALRAEAVINIISGKSDSPEIFVSDSRKVIMAKHNDITLKLRGGPYFCINLDFANKKNKLITQLKNYRFAFEGVDSTTNGEFWVMSFRKRLNRPGLNAYGKIYIDKKSSSLVKAEVEVCPEGIVHTATNKSGQKIEITYKRKTYTINYIPVNGKWCLQSVKSEETRRIANQDGRVNFVTDIAQLIIIETGGDYQTEKLMPISRREVFADKILKQ